MIYCLMMGFSSPTSLTPTLRLSISLTVGDMIRFCEIWQ